MTFPESNPDRPDPRGLREHDIGLLFDQWLNERNQEAEWVTEEIEVIFLNLMLRLRVSFTFEEMHQFIHALLVQVEALLQNDVMRLRLGDLDLPFMVAEDRRENPEAAAMNDQVMDLAMGRVTVPDTIEGLDVP